MKNKISDQGPKLTVVQQREYTLEVFCNDILVILALILFILHLLIHCHAIYFFYIGPHQTNIVKVVTSDPIHFAMP